MRGLSHKAKNIKITLGSAVSVAALIFMGGVMTLGSEVAAEGSIQNSTGLNLSVNISQVMAIRTLDVTATSDIAALNFAITPTPDGVRQTNTTVVDVATSNVSGYKLMMNSDYRTDGTSSDTPSAAEFTTSLINTDSAIAATSVGQIATTAGSSTASSTSYWNYSKSWNETLGSEGHTQDFSSTGLTSASLNNLAIPAQSTPDTVRDDVDIATSSSQTSVSVNVNAATDKSSGVYKNELVFTAIANPIPVDYTLTFNKNTSDTVTNLPDPLTATATATSYNFTIPSVSTMARSGYQFIGWSTSASSRQGSGSGPDGLYIAGDTYTVIADDSGNPDYTTHGTGSSTLYAIWAQEYTLTVNPNGGTWNGSTSSQNFNDISEATKIIADPTVTPAYAITYDANSQDASYTGTPTSVSRSFNGWSLSGSGSWDSNNSTYTYGTSAGTLTANYNATSASFNLPAITKDGYTCKWAEGSTSGTQYEGGDERTITENTTYYATCEQDRPPVETFTVGSQVWTANVIGNGYWNDVQPECEALGAEWRGIVGDDYSTLISTSEGRNMAYTHWGTGFFTAAQTLRALGTYGLYIESSSNMYIHYSQGGYGGIVCVQR